MKKFFQEFKEFATRGSVIDLAVGVIIGAAFQKIVTSLVDDIISPLIGLIAKTDLSNLSVSILGVSLRYGSFITAVINFIIMAFVIFVIVKAINRVSTFNAEKFGKKDEKAPTTKKCPYCMSEVDIKATRCPHCTSQLENLKDEDETK